MKDLVVLVPDKNVKFGLESLLKRYDSLGTIPLALISLFIRKEIQEFTKTHMIS